MISKIVYFNTHRTLRISQPQDERNKMDQKWKNLSKMAQKTNQNFVDPVLPFNEGFVLSDYNSVYKSIYNKEKYLND